MPFAAALVVLLAAWNNVVVPRLADGRIAYVVVNVVAAAVLLAAARWAGLHAADLGLARRDLPAGAVLGGACLAIVAVFYVVAVAVPATRPLLTDSRVGGLSAGEVAFRALIRIPFGTVLWEEVAFRGVLLGVLARLFPVRVAAALSAVVFGIWHVRPTLGALAANDVTVSPVATGGAVLVACVLMVAAGGFFAWLRLRSGSLLAPALLHLATNSLGTLAAAAAFHLG